MRDSRAGESLWLEWEGPGLGQKGILYYTIGHVDIDHEVVRRALASRLQRDGVADGLGDAFRLLETFGDSGWGWGGYIAGESEMVFCGQDGKTEVEDQVEEVLDLTWVEVSA